MRSLDPVTVNHIVLRKQHLTEETQSEDIVQIARDLCGLHATSPTTPYLSLFARAPGFARERLSKELYVERSLGRIRCMRRTVHILAKEFIPVVFSATRRMVDVASERYCQYLGVTREQYLESSKAILRMLEGRGMTANEVRRSLETDLNVSAILNLMCDQGLLIRGNPGGGWKSNVHTYYRFSDYFPDLDLNAVAEPEARRFLVKLYLASFGPVTENDIVWWTGFAKREVSRMLECLRDHIASVEIAGMKEGHLVLRSDLRGFRSLPSELGIVNLLPSLDPCLMGYKRRERFLDQEHYEYVFDRSGNAASTVLLDGRVIGVWDIAEEAEPLVKYFLFERVQKATLDKIHLKAKRIGRFILEKEVGTKKCDSMVPLTRRTAGGVMTPLKGC